MMTSRYWPFSVRWAFFASLILVPGLVALAVWLYRPEGPLATRLTFAPLLLAVLLGLLPVVLVLLGGVRSVEAAGVKVAFTAVQGVVETSGVVTAQSLIADNLGSPPGQVTDQSSDTIIDWLRDATTNRSVVVNLKRGDEWWDTRLLVLVAGAVRLAFPKAIVFISTTAGRPNVFVGWATPSELLHRLVAMDPALCAVYQATQRDWLLRQLSDATPTGRVLPWAPAGKKQENVFPGQKPLVAVPIQDGKVEYPWPSPDAKPAPPFPHLIREDGFEPERLLLSKIQELERVDRPRLLTEVRVQELFRSVLHTEAVDREDDAESWIQATLTSTTDFFAVTKRREFENLVPRRTAVNAILLVLISGSSHTRQTQE